MSKPTASMAEKSFVQTEPLTAASIEEAIRSIEPGAYFVAPRILRRVLHRDAGGWFGRRFARRDWYVIPSARALEILDRDEIGVGTDTRLPDILILLTRPDPENLAAQSGCLVLRSIWGRIFAARVEIEVRRLFEQGRLGDADPCVSVLRLEPSECEGIRVVLEQDRQIAPASDSKDVFVAFASTYLALRQFAPQGVSDFFPSLAHAVDRLDAAMAEILDVPGLLAATRPAGTCDPVLPAEVEDIDDEEEPEEIAGTGSEPPPPELGPRDRRRYSRLMAWARRAEGRANLVRGAICRLQAAQQLPAALQPAAHRGAVRLIERLTRRLAEPLALSRRETHAWSRLLPSLLDRASHGLWSREARLLYDLQKIVVEHKREIDKVDLAGWIRSLGRRPLRQPLPFHREVLQVRHLRAARRRLGRIGIDENVRSQLIRLVSDATDHAERRLRDSFRAPIDATLDARGWIPRNLPEEVARERMVEELLDLVVERGFLVVGDFRDAVARSDLKLPDLASMGSLIRGDRMIKTDRALSSTLAGVYRRSEIYLRWLLRFSSVAFGTRPGRWATLYLALPFLSAFVALKGTDALSEEVAHLVGGHRTHLLSWPSFLGLGLFLEAMIHSPTFRRGVRTFLGRVGSALQWVLITPVRWLRDQPWFQAILASRTVAALMGWVFGPLGLALTTFAILRAGGVLKSEATILGGLAYVLAILLFNSRQGRDLGEIITDRVVHLGRSFAEFLPGLFRVIMRFFAKLLEQVERVIYTIDEWLRFRSGEGRVSLVLKAVFGLIWAGITYVIRFVVNLVAEPQLNPIKHFPVVTVAHKVMFPLVLAAHKAMMGPPPMFRPWLADVLTVVIQFAVPGICGFLVWEFKGNWRLYQANRPRTLRPMVVGRHGETVKRLLEPGFHSGTIPRLYAKLRRADRATQPGRRASIHKHREGLEHVAHAVRAFTERDLLAILKRSQAFSEHAIEVREVRLGVIQIVLELIDPDQPAHSIELIWEARAGWLVASLHGEDALAAWDEDRRATFRDALAGFLKHAGVDLDMEQLRAGLGPGARLIAIDENGLRVALKSGPDVQLRINEEPIGLQAGAAPPGAVDRPDLDPESVIFARVPLTWDHWVAIWQRDRLGQHHPEPAIPGAALLPAPITPTH